MSVYKCSFRIYIIFYHRRPFNKTAATLVRPHPISTLCTTPLGKMWVCIFVRCPQKGGKHTWDPGKVDRQYFIQTMSHLSHPAAWSWSQSGRWGMYHGHSLTAASRNKNINVCKSTKADCHCWDPVACLCILLPPWLYVSDIQNGLSAVNWCIQLMTGSIPGRGGSK